MKLPAAIAVMVVLSAAQLVRADDGPTSLFVVHFSTGPAWAAALRDVEEMLPADPGVQPLKVFFPWRDAGPGTD